MGANSKIEWTDHTFNPWIGCEKVSPGCKLCYAERYGDRFGVGWGRPYRRTSEDNWRKPLAWNRQAEAARKRWAQLGAVGAPPPRPRVFSASLADWLDAKVPSEWLADLLALVAATPDLDWLLLTKRPALWAERLHDALQAIETSGPRDGDEYHEPETHAFVRAWLDGEAPSNVWLGTTVEDQQRADERIPVLLSIPARVRFLSCEPLLGPVNVFDDFLSVRDEHGEPSGPRCRPGGGPAIDWIIAGGESDIGDGARPMHPTWARSLRWQATEAGVAFFFKQWGDWEPRERDDGRPFDSLAEHNRDRLVELRGGVSCTQEAAGDGYACMSRVGKKVAGRELDGRTWDELPRVRP